MIEPVRENDALIYGDVSDSILDTVLEIAHGNNREDKQFGNRLYTGERLLSALSKFQRGQKDGPCILQGAVVDPPAGRRGVPRVAVNMRINSIMMFDHDTGDTMDEIAAKIAEKKLFCVLWTTHSHMKPETMVPESAVIQYLKNTGVRVSEPSHQQVLDYVRQVLKIGDEFLTEARVLGREMALGGRKYRVAHKAITRVRSLFFLKDPFDFATRAGSQKSAIDEWKALYVGATEWLDLPSFDPKCLDPSRLMYLPRIAEDADIRKHEIRVIAGDFLDLATITPAKGKTTSQASAPANPFTAAVTKAGAGDANNTTNFRTPGLGTFLKEHADDFEAEAWLENDDQDKLCPFHEQHTSSENGRDTGFKAWNASETGGSGFGMQCSHSCGADPARGQGSNGKQDRAKFLDALCVLRNIQNVNELIEWCPAALAKREEKQKAQSDLHTNIQTAISGVTIESTTDDIEAVLRLMAMRPAGMQDEIDLEALKNRGPVGKRALRTSLVTYRREHAGEHVDRTLADDPPAPVRRPVPENLAETPHIYLDWDWDVVVRATKERIVYLNNQNPCLFARPEGGVMRVQDRPDGTAQAVTVKIPQWAAELSERLSYREVINEVEMGCQPPAALKEILVGTSGLNFAPLDRIVRVPVFAADGTLRTGRGYDAALQCYLDPEIDFMPLPDKITPEAVDYAVDNLMEAVRDFPFSDTMNGDDKLPVKLAEKDDQGFAFPNWERGKCSRANMIAMILQPFVRNMIGGPCPAYHLGKSAAGTGAGYLVDVAHIIAEGSKATAQPMSYDNEEFRKSITATLRSGASFIFIDNVNRKIDSGELAAALTAGKWRDRIIMSSDVVLIQMNALWVFAGNNLSFSHELMRRNVPIRLDAAVPKPAQDRSRKDFKHYPLQDWLLASRPLLVWSCHVLVQNWINTWERRTRETEFGPVIDVLDPKWGNGKLLSFDHYAGVMSGILETAGISGFLGNVEDYLNTQDTERNSFEELAQRMFDAYPKRLMTAKEILAVTKNPITQEIEVELPIENKDEHRQLIDLGKLLQRHMVGQTFDVLGKVTELPQTNDDTDTERKVPQRPILRVKLLINDGKNRTKYKFETLDEAGR